MFKVNSKPIYDGSKTWWFGRAAEGTALKDANFVSEANVLEARDSYFKALDDSRGQGKLDAQGHWYGKGYNEGYDKALGIKLQ